MSVLKKLKDMVKEAKDDIERSQAEYEAQHQSQDIEQPSQPEQTSSEDKVEKIKQYRKSASNENSVKSNSTETKTLKLFVKIHYQIRGKKFAKKKFL